MSAAGSVPVREWLLSPGSENRKATGNAIRAVEFWRPAGMPLLKAVGDYVRTDMPDGRIARVFFCVHEGAMALLRGFIRKTQKTPVRELDVARGRMRGLK